MKIVDGEVFVGVTELRKNMNYFMDQLEADPTLVLTITRYGKPVCVMISHKLYEVYKAIEGVNDDRDR